MSDLVKLNLVDLHFSRSIAWRVILEIFWGLLQFSLNFGSVEEVGTKTVQVSTYISPVKDHWEKMFDINVKVFKHFKTFLHIERFGVVLHA